MTFFYKNAINVFTDASLVRKNDTPITCSGFITMQDGNIIDKGLKVIHGSTNMYGEIYAIKMGIENLLQYKDTDRFLNLFSDSRVSIFGLREWIMLWYSNSQDKILKNSSNVPVYNQEVILEIMRLIVQSKVHVNFYHIPGHMRPNNEEDMSKFRSIFLKNFNSDNYFNNPLSCIPNDILVEMCVYNNMIDKMSRHYLNQIVESKDYDPNKYKRYSIYPFYWFPKEQDMETYQQLII